MMDGQIDNFLKRLILAALFPNVLVWGFFEVGINRNSNPLWRYLVGPYWHFEVFLFYAVVTIACLGLAFLCLTGIVAAGGHLWEFYENLQVKKEAREIERIRALELAAIKQREEEARRAFQALPQEEQIRIINDRRAAEEARVREQERRFDELEHRRQEKKAEAKREKEAELTRIRALENSPDFKRKQALRSFVGGRSE